MGIKFKEFLYSVCRKLHINTPKLKEDIELYYCQLELKDIYENDIET